MPIVAFGAAAGVMAYKVDQELTRVTKVYDTTATTMMGKEKELQAVREDSMKTAIESAKAYGSSATDTLNVASSLAATGKRGAELQKSTAEVMRIARLGDLEYQDAINTTISLQSVFKMSNQELAQSFDYMNAVENATSLETKDFAAAIPIAAAPVKAFGGDIQELGVLLTAMKSQGIEATQGANAIKAAMQRLGRPSKQIQEEWTALTGTDITQIFDNSENLIDLFTRIKDATKNLGRKDQIKAFAGLFGTYQVTRMMALTKGMNDLNDATTQTGKAYQLAGQDAKDWAKIAEQETKRIQESVSGKLKSAFATLMVEVSTMGKPFIVAAAVIIKAVAGIIGWFNKLPKGIKLIAGLGIGIVALAGPIVMLAGLFGNLLGSGIKVFAFILGKYAELAGAMKIATFQERAAALAARMGGKEFNKEATDAQLLTEQLALLNQALAENNALNVGGIPAGAVGGRTASGIILPAGVSAREVAAETEKAVPATEKLKQGWGKISGSMGVASLAAVGMGASMIPMNHTAQDIVGTMTKWAFLASLLQPAFMGVLGVVKQIGPNLLRAGAASGSLAAKGASFFKNMVMSIGKLNLIVAGLAAAAGFAYWLWKRHQAIVAEELKEEQAIYKNASIQSDALDIQIKKRKELAAIDIYALPNGGPNATEIAAGIKNSRTGIVNKFRDSSAEVQQAIAGRQYLEVLKATGGNADKARLQVEGLYLAATNDAAAATAAATEFTLSLGSMGAKAQQIDIWRGLMESAASMDYRQNVPKIGDELFTELEQSMAEAKTNLKRKHVFEDFSRAINQEYKRMFEDLDSGTQDSLKKFGVDSVDEWQQMMKDYQDAVAGGMSAQDFGAKYNVDSLKNAMPGMDMQALGQFGTTLNGITAQLGDKYQNLSATESEIVDKMKKRLGITADIHSLAELEQTDQYKLLTMSKKQTEQWYLAKAAMIDLMDPLKFFGDQTAESTKLIALNTARAARGLAPVEDIALGFWDETNRINSALNTQVGILGAVAQATRQAYAGISRQDFVSTYQAGMQNVQQGIADDLSSAFDTRMNNALDSRQKYWDGRADKLNNDLDRKNNALDARWQRKNDAAQKYWDGRIGSVQKAMDAEQKADDLRQKLFDKEIDRINKLNEAQNQNIDFNVALNSGNFDEAAKIRNDVAATDAQTALEKAQAAGTAQSEKRVARLQKRQDALEKARDRAMKHLKKEEDAERAHLAKISKMRQDALKRDQEADMETQKAIWDDRKATLDATLEMFMSFIAANEGQLKKHMDNMGLAYGGFENKTIDPKSKKWGEMFGDRLHKGMREAGLKLASDSMWTILGKSGSDAILKSMGFGNMSDFRYFVKTGEFRNTGNKVKNQNPGKSSGDLSGYVSGGAVVKHEGGMIGDGKNSRKGVARNVKGLHSSEAYVKAQLGEYVVNRKDAAKHKPVLDAINSGRGIDTKNPQGGEPGVAGLMSAVMNKMLVKGIQRAMGNKYTDMVKKMARQAGNLNIFGSFSSAKPGTYGDRFFNAQQLKNATTIASVGKSMGMSARDIEIGIMTAITESGLVNVNYGDRDSLGLFQQRPSMGWGTPQQVTDPKYAAHTFFSRLKGVEGRTGMTPWMAAQSVQRSAYSDGSNYQQYWDEALAIFKSMGRTKSDGKIGGGYVAGQGGWHKASTPGKGWVNTHDYRNGLGSPLYAASDGTVVISKATTSGGTPGNGLYGNKYTSYGETILLRTASGDLLRYAHLNPGARYVRAGQTVKGGALIGRSGMTGNATGPHTHFDVNGDYNASGWMRAHGIGLSKGAANVRWDNTLANLHHGEAVLTKDLNQKFHQGVENFASGGNSEYTINVNLYGTNVDEDEVVRKTMTAIKRKEGRKPRSRSNNG
jgi:TP901 family phage tail tape measure protein